MANSWRWVSGPDTKHNVAVALGNADISDALSLDAPAQDLVSDLVAQSQFAQATLAGSAILAAMSGNAPNARVIVSGYHDPQVSAPIPGGRGSSVTVQVDEFWT